jgi:AraC family transcriptional regulator
MAAQSVESALVSRFHLARAPTLEARVSGTPPIVFSRMRAEASQPGRSISPREESAFAFQVPLIPASFSSLKYGSRVIALPEIQEPGRAFLFDLSARPTVGLDTAFDNVRCYISQRTLDDMGYERGLARIGGLLQRSFGGRDPILFHLAQSLVPALENEGAASAAFVEYVALAFHEHVITTYGGVPAIGRSPSGGLAPWQIKRACDFIGAHLDGDPSLASLSLECQVSPSYFARAFRATMGMAPHQWIVRKRIERAKSLMTSSDRSVAEIAVMCGFVDQSHLSRAFARDAGMSPAKWRRLTAVGSH